MHSPLKESFTFFTLMKLHGLKKKMQMQMHRNLHITVPVDRSCFRMKFSFTWLYITHKQTIWPKNREINFSNIKNLPLRNRVLLMFYNRKKKRYRFVLFYVIIREIYRIFDYSRNMYLFAKFLLRIQESSTFFTPTELHALGTIQMHIKICIVLHSCGRGPCPPIVLPNERCTDERRYDTTEMCSGTHCTRRETRYVYCISVISREIRSSPAGNTSSFIALPTVFLHVHGTGPGPIQF